jgi:DNA polymerase I-like protein with 3'-5' exonuclease and polymerase domains
LPTVLVIDFECKDKQLKTLGSGWAYNSLDNVTDDYFPIGCVVKQYDSDNIITNEWLELLPNGSHFEDNLSLLKSYVHGSDVLVAHNAQYDFGTLHYLGVNEIHDKTLVDTVMLAKHYDNTLLSYKLDDLGQKYLDKSKLTSELAEFVRDNHLYQDSKGKTVKTKDLNKCEKWAMANLDVLYNLNPELVVKYCQQDVNLTDQLYSFYINQKEWITDEWIYRDSVILKQLIKGRANGICVDKPQLTETRDYCKNKEDKALQECKSILGEHFAFDTTGESDSLELAELVNNFNPDKKDHLKTAVDALEIPYEIKKKTGNPTLDKAWLQKQNHPFCKALKEYRRYQKVRRDFCDKILNLGTQLGQTGDIIKLYPTFNPFGAETGRFTANSPTLQNIPARDVDLGHRIRGCFIPHPGYQMFQMDYGQQEFRLFAHYCYLTKIDAILKLEYDKDPTKDYHNMVTVEVLGMPIENRPYAKEINLGSLYGMGKKKQTLKLKERGLGQLEAESVYDKYHSQFPSVKKFSKYCAEILRQRGFIKTLLGRRSRLDKPYRDPESGELLTFEYQAISKVIQGAAADQMIETLVKCHEAGLGDYILFSIHDQIVGQVPVGEEEKAKEIQQIMLNSVKLSVPMTADLGYGKNWNEAESVKH